jgi:hypothetical protein
MPGFRYQDSTAQGSGLMPIACTHKSHGSAADNLVILLLKFVLLVGDAALHTGTALCALLLAPFEV